MAQQAEQIAQQAEQIAYQKEQIQGLKDEVARLKKHTQRPKLKPSALESTEPGKDPGKRKRKQKKRRRKKPKTVIHETVVVPPAEPVPKGSRFKGYDDFTVVGLKFEPHTVRYRLAVWKTPDGQRVKGVLPEAIEILGGHFSPHLVGFILHQHHHARVPQALIWEQLSEIGVPISYGQVNQILLKYTDGFEAEKEALLEVGLQVSQHVHVDDTGARHQGKNGVCTHIGNEWFAYFCSTDSKSRINFLEVLRGKHEDYVLDEEALAYMQAQKLPKFLIETLRDYSGQLFADRETFEVFVTHLNVSGQRHRQIVTEGCLVASVLSHGIHPELVIVSDDAGQFNVLRHALCWIHAERTLAKLVGFNDTQRKALEQKRSEVWALYDQLKAYKAAPTPEAKAQLANQFDAIFSERTCFVSLNLALKRLEHNKSELLLVLELPDLPLHNNLSEQDIREYTIKRKISGSTRSDRGRRCRDTFASLKKTCRKHGISFWHYLIDRLSASHRIPTLPNLIAQRAAEAPT